MPMRYAVRHGGRLPHNSPNANTLAQEWTEKTYNRAQHWEEDCDGERDRLLDGICEINRSAKTEYLMQFRTDALKLYLEHLRTTLTPRGKEAVWNRPGDSCGITRYAPS